MGSNPKHALKQSIKHCEEQAALINSTYLETVLHIYAIFFSRLLLLSFGGIVKFQYSAGLSGEEKGIVKENNIKIKHSVVLT